MNPENPSREEIEAKLTALLLGELPAEEAQLLRWAVSQDAELAKLHDRLKAAIGFVSEVAANPAETIPAQTAPLKLSDERREKLLAHFKTVRPIVFLPPLKKRREISPLLAMAAAVALIAVLAAMLLPSLSAAKRKTQHVTMLSASMEKTQAAAERSRIDQNVPVATTPQAGLDQRVTLLEAKIQNGNPTANGGDSFQKQNQTTIVLPAGGASSRDQNVYSVPMHNADSYQAAAVLQNMFQSSNGSRSSTTTGTANGNAGGNPFAARFGGGGGGGFGGGVAEGGRGGGGVLFGGSTPSASAITAFQFATGDNSAVALEDETASGKVAFDDGGAQLNGVENRFYRSKTPDSGADQKSKMPMLGDIPLIGNQFKSSPANKDFYDDTFPTTPATPFPTGGDLGAPKNMGEFYLAGNAPVSAANSWGQFQGNTVGGIAAPSANDQLIASGLNNSVIRAFPNINITAGTQNSGSGSSVTYNNVQYENNGTVRAAQISPDSDTHNLVVTADAPTTEQIQNTLKNLDRASVAAKPTPPVTQNMFRERLAYVDDQNLVGKNYVLGVAIAGIASASASTYAPQAAMNRRPQMFASPSPVVAENEPVATSALRPQQAIHMGIPAKDTNDIVFNFRNAPLDSVLRYMSDAYGFNIVLNTPIRGNVSIIQTHPMTKDEAVNLLNTVLNQNGYAAVRDGQTMTIINKDEAKTTDVPLPKTPSPAPVPQPEILTRENAFSTFSLNVSDVSFKLAAASLEKNVMPDAASIRSEEFINAFDYRDPEPKWDSASSLSAQTGRMPVPQPVAFVAERARDPFAHNRDLLRFSIKTAAAGREANRPLNIVLLLDNSGSMERADRVAIIHEALKVLASELQPQDTLSIVTFARTARLWVDGARGDQAGTAVNKVSDLTPEGGTNLEEAMNLAYATARRHYLANGGNRVVLLTDGAANLGNVDPEALKQKVESFRKQGIALDCFGIGWEGYNDDLLEVLSSNGDGRYGFINTPEAATTEFAAQLAGALHVAAEDVKVQVEFNPQRVISYRQIGYAKHQLTKEQFRDNTVAAAPMAAREAGNALYTVEVNPSGTGPVATVRVRFRIPGTTDVSEHEWEVPFDGTAPTLEKSSPALRLAATASAFSEWLASSPYAQEVTTDQLLNYLNGVPAIYGADARPKQLETMIREAKSLSGK